MTLEDDLKHNLLLATLPNTEFECLAAHMEHVEFKLGHVLYESGDELSYAY